MVFYQMFERFLLAYDIANDQKESCEPYFFCKLYQDQVIDKQENSSARWRVVVGSGVCGWLKCQGSTELRIFMKIFSAISRPTAILESPILMSKGPSFLF